MQKQMVEAINNAIGAHGAWKMRLRTAITSGRGDIPSNTACKDDQCAFGKWLHGNTIPQPIKAGIPYGVIKRLHADFHQSAGSVLAYVERNDSAGAQNIMDGDFAARSEKLVRAMAKWKGEIAAK